MKNVWFLCWLALSFPFIQARPGLAQVVLPPDGAGIEVTVQLEVAVGPVLSLPPPLPVPVLPGSKVRFTLSGPAVSEATSTAWTRNGVALGGRGNELVVSDASEADTGNYLVTVTTRGGDVVVVSRVLHVSPFPRQRLLNLSTRATVSPASPTVIAGFVVDAGPGDAASSKEVLIRAVGPSLADYGVTVALIDPTLRLFRSDGSAIEVAASVRDPQRIAEAGLRTGATPLRPSAADTGLLLSLRGGAYTAHVTSAGNHTGEILIEVYEVPRGSP